MDAVLLGLAVGLGAGISPGPLLVLVITVSQRSGRRAGMLAACAPLVTDALVAAGSLLVLAHLSDRVLTGLGIAGGVALVALGARTAVTARTATPSVPGSLRTGRWRLRDLARAAALDLAGPRPWITWPIALGPLVVTTWRSSAPTATLLVIGFYVALVGTTIVMALLTRSRQLTDRTYQRAVLVAATVLVAAGAALVVGFAARL